MTGAITKAKASVQAAKTNIETYYSSIIEINKSGKLIAENTVKLTDATTKLTVYTTKTAGYVKDALTAASIEKGKMEKEIKKIEKEINDATAIHHKFDDIYKDLIFINATTKTNKMIVSITTSKTDITE